MHRQGAHHAVTASVADLKLADTFPDAGAGCHPQQLLVAVKLGRQVLQVCIAVCSKDERRASDAPVEEDSGQGRLSPPPLPHTLRSCEHTRPWAVSWQWLLLLATMAPAVTGMPRLQGRHARAGEVRLVSFTTEEVLVMCIRPVHGGTRLKGSLW